MTSISQSPRVQSKTAGRADGLNHYLRKVDITRAVVDGVPVTALCGIVFRPTSQGRGSVGARARAICPLCQLVFDELPS